MSATQNQVRNPGSGISQSIVGATVGWTNPSNIASSNNVYATASLTTAQNISDNEVKLVVGYDLDFSIFTLGSYNHADVAAYTGSDTYSVHGGDGDRWQHYLTPTKVNAAFTFGCALSCRDSSPTPLYTDHLIGYNYGFTIPDKAFITGVKARIEKKAVYSSRTGITTISVDHIELTVYYNYFLNIRIISLLVPLFTKLLVGITATGILSMFGINKLSYKDGLVIHKAQTRCAKNLQFV